MPVSPSPSFAFFAQGDAYSMSGKIMGRQSAGEGFLRGLGRTWRHGDLQAVCYPKFNTAGLVETLRAADFAGRLQVSRPPEFTGACNTGALYYPAPINPGLARMRNRISPTAFSLFGVTHTLSTDRALDGISAFVMPPYRSWDALVCTSRAARDLVNDLLAETREELAREAGVARFVDIQTPVIPLGVHCSDFVSSAELKVTARQVLGVQTDEIVVLSAGRLTFHAKANPAQLYSALQAVSGEAKFVCVEAGIFPNQGVQAAYQQAKQALAPDVRFIHVPGGDAALYKTAWRAADMFASLSDNIQETFGLTPVEAMAAGLPVVATDWNGYRDTVRHGRDGFLVPTLAAPAGAGLDIGLAVETEVTNYDRFIGLVSMAVSVDARALQQALKALATDTELRARMGENGRQRAEQLDWLHTLAAYDALAEDLASIRTREARPSEAWPARREPFSRFEKFSTRRFGATDIVRPSPDAIGRLNACLGLEVAIYANDARLLPLALSRKLLEILAAAEEPQTVQALLKTIGGALPAHQRVLAWMAKFEIVEILTT